MHLQSESCSTHHSSDFVLLDAGVNVYTPNMLYLLNIQSQSDIKHIHGQIIAWVHRLVSKSTSYPAPQVVNIGNYIVGLCHRDHSAINVPKVFGSLLHNKICSPLKVTVLVSTSDPNESNQEIANVQPKMKKQMVVLQRQCISSQSYDPQLLEIRSSVNWLPIKDKILSKMASLTKGILYPPYVSIVIGTFLIETLEKSEKLTSIPKSMQGVLRKTAMSPIKIKITNLAVCPKVMLNQMMQNRSECAVDSVITTTNKIIADSAQVYIDSADASIMVPENNQVDSSNAQPTYHVKTMASNKKSLSTFKLNMKTSNNNNNINKNVSGVSPKVVIDTDKLTIDNMNSIIIKNPELPLSVNVKSPLIDAISLVAEDITIDSMENPDTRSAVSKLLDGCDGEVNITIDHSEKPLENGLLTEEIHAKMISSAEEGFYSWHSTQMLEDHCYHKVLIRQNDILGEKVIYCSVYFYLHYLFIYE